MRIKIINGCIIDGTGKKDYKSDLAIENGRIIAISSKIEGEFEKIIDATDCVISPGFIDTHSHSDLKILETPYVAPKIRQGVTTEILGQDGISLAPLPKEYIEDWRKNISGLEGESNIIDWSYETTEGYFKLLENSNLVMNAAYLVPHGNVRMEAMGLTDRKATKKELKKMKEIIQREIDAGAIGLSSGLIYTPCAYGNLEELIEICKVVAKNNGVFVVHQRSEANTIISSIEEILEVGRQSGIKIHFSHFKICGRNNWNKINQVLTLLDQAKAEGIEVSFDQYPYGVGSTMLSVILPPWIHAGGTNQLLSRLKDLEIRKKLIEEIMMTNCEWDNFVEFAGLDGIFITSVKHKNNENVIGKNLVELGVMRNQAPLEAAFDLLIEEDNSVGMIDYYGKEEHIKQLILRPEQNVCTDGLLGGKPHPRAYGAFPKILSHFVREEKVLSLESAIYKMTGRPASVFGLENRGLIKEGYWADIVIFDPETICDRATFLNPEQYPDGIHWVMINGHIVLEHGKELTQSSGRLLRFGKVKEGVTNV